MIDFMPEYQKLSASDTGLCEHGNFLPCEICDEQKTENTSEIDQESPEDRELIEILRKECGSPVGGAENMPVVSYEAVMKEFGTTDLKIITESEKYKQMLEKGFVLGSGEERIYDGKKPGQTIESKEPSNTHLGVDYMLKEGVDIGVIADGEIIDIRKPEDFVSDVDKLNLYKGEGGYGNMILVKHKLGNGKEIYSLYGHLADDNDPEKQFKIGDQIHKGEKIGKVGKSFSAENGGWPSHLHFSIMKNPDDISGYGTKDDVKNIIDPVKVFKNRGK